MNGEAQELREVALAIEQVAVKSRAYSMVAAQVQQLLDYIMLRALVMELQGQRDERATAIPEEPR
jgi:hypothetical protein